MLIASAGAKKLRELLYSPNGGNFQRSCASYWLASLEMSKTLGNFPDHARRVRRRH